LPFSALVNLPRPSFVDPLVPGLAFIVRMIAGGAKPSRASAGAADIRLPVLSSRSAWFIERFINSLTFAASWLHG
jgi:hypothetical protein